MASTRHCAPCHPEFSLFSHTMNPVRKELQIGTLRLRKGEATCQSPINRKRWGWNLNAGLGTTEPTSWSTMLVGCKDTSCSPRKMVDLCFKVLLACNLWYFLDIPNPWFHGLACFSTLATYFSVSPSRFFLSLPSRFFFFFFLHPCNSIGVFWCFLQLFQPLSLWIGSVVGHIKSADMFGLAHKVLAHVVFLKFLN